MNVYINSESTARFCVSGDKELIKNATESLKGIFNEIRESKNNYIPEQCEKHKERLNAISKGMNVQNAQCKDHINLRFPVTPLDSISATIFLLQSYLEKASKNLEERRIEMQSKTIALTVLGVFAGMLIGHAAKKAEWTVVTGATIDISQMANGSISSVKNYSFNYYTALKFITLGTVVVGAGLGLLPNYDKDLKSMEVQLEEQFKNLESMSL